MIIISTLDTSVHSVVPYIPPKSTFLDILKKYLFASSQALYAFFSKRKTLYYFFFALISFGVLIGAYYSSMHPVALSTGDLILSFKIVLWLSFFLGITFFGIPMIPIVSFCISFFCGMILRNNLLNSFNNVLLLFFVWVFLLFAVLFFAEAFDSSKRSLMGFRSMFFCKYFIVFLCLFVCSVFSCELLSIIS